jgi:hypothetical protein
VRHGPSNVGDHALRGGSATPQRKGHRTRNGGRRPGDQPLLARRPVDGRGRLLIDSVVVDVSDHADHLQPGSVPAYVDAFPDGTLDGIPGLAREALGYQGHVPLRV